MKTVFATTLLHIICSGFLTPTATASPIVGNDILHRTSDTCADPTLTSVYVEAYDPANTAHTVDPLWKFVVVDTILGDDWQIQGEMFRAWENPDPQGFTFPLYSFQNSVTDDVMVEISTTGSPPNPGSDWTVLRIIGYVYATQVCGSLPLLVAFQEAQSDHWYTTDVNQHNAFLAKGYTDAGIACYVLPLDSNP